jgi:hypothetical protein
MRIEFGSENAEGGKKRKFEVSDFSPAAGRELPVKSRKKLHFCNK